MRNPGKAISNAMKKKIYLTSDASNPQTATNTNSPSNGGSVLNSQIEALNNFSHRSSAPIQNQQNLSQIPSQRALQGNPANIQSRKYTNYLYNNIMNTNHEKINSILKSNQILGIGGRGAAIEAVPHGKSRSVMKNYGSQLSGSKRGIKDHLTINYQSPKGSVKMMNPYLQQ